MNQSWVQSPTQSTELATVNDDLLVEYLGTLNLAVSLTDKEKRQFITVAKEYGLNPFKREIYVSKYNGNDGFSVIVGFETYLKRAERSGKLDGWEAEFFGAGEDLSCVVTIYRKDWTRPFKHEAFYSECVQKTKEGHVTKFWKKAKLMTRKVAISQAFRMAFPDELGGLPYTNDELSIDVQDTTHEVVQERQAYQTQPAQQAVVAQPEPKKLTKLENAELMQSLQNWNTMLGQLESDNERNGNPEEWNVLASALGGIKNLAADEKKSTFWAMVKVAESLEVYYDKGKTNKFFTVVPDAVEAEEVENVVDEELDLALANDEQ